MEKKVVDVFIPCFIDQLQPEIGFSMVKVLEKVGCEVRYNPKQTCCGQPAYNAGYFKEACRVAEKFLDDFDNPHTYVVAPSASCIGMVRNSYETLLKNEIYQKKYFSLAERAFELSEFLVDVMGVQKIENAYFPYTVTYHDSCSALRECIIHDAPRALLSKVNGLKLIEMKETESCCGFGGTFAVKFHGISSAMAEQKTQAALAAQAEYIVSTDYSCLMHLEAFIQKKSLPLKTIHLADLLASGW